MTSRPFIRTLLIVCLATLVCSLGLQAQTFPPVLQGDGDKLAEIPGFRYRTVGATKTDSQQKTSIIPAVKVSAEDLANSGGDQAETLPLGGSLSWRVQKPVKGEYYLYFLCRTGHADGYEYLRPYMSFQAFVNGQPVALEMSWDTPALRTFTSPDGWKIFIGYVRSVKMQELSPGDVISFSCTQENAFVTSLTLLGTAEIQLMKLHKDVQESIKNQEKYNVLLDKIQENFGDSLANSALEKAAETLADSLRPLVQIEKNIAQVLAESHQRQITAEDHANIAAQFTEAQNLISQNIEPFCNSLLTEFRQMALSVEGDIAQKPDYPCNFYGRQAEYYHQMAEKYLLACQQKIAQESDNLYDKVKLSATYLKRTREFARKSSEALLQAQAAKSELSAPQKVCSSLVPTERNRILLNGEWDFNPAGTPCEPLAGNWSKIRVPHGPWSDTIGRVVALDQPEGWSKDQHFAWYRVQFPVPADWQDGGCLTLRFGGVIHLCEIYVNGYYCGRHIGGFDAFDIDVTSVVKTGQQNELLCMVYDSSITATDKSFIPDEAATYTSGPNYYMISDLWWTHYGCIWQNVSLEHKPAVQVKDVFVMTSVKQKTLTLQTELHNGGNQAIKGVLVQDVLDSHGNTVFSLPESKIAINPGSTVSLQQQQIWENPQLWGIGGEWGDPRNLYFVQSRLYIGDDVTNAQEQLLDTHIQRFGFREFTEQNGHYYLNGHRLHLQGGGSWYLQENKSANGNRWFYLPFLHCEREMNVNLERWHRHGDIDDDLMDLTDELGMLSEIESAYWGISGIPDIMGRPDWDDPVWTENLNQHYRSWVRRQRNHPSLMLWAVENECFVTSREIAPKPETMVQRFLEFGRLVKNEDPTRPITFHGMASGGYCDDHPEIENVNLHYPPNNAAEDWRERWGGRPCLVGEFQDYTLSYLMCGQSQEESSRKLDGMAKFIKDWTRFYRGCDVAGEFFFMPAGLVGLYSHADRSLMGPWGDCLPALDSVEPWKEGVATGCVFLTAKIPIEWPSVSGPGIKCDNLVTGANFLTTINWFDRERVAYTPNKAYFALKQYWDIMPPLNTERPPEILVTVLKNGKPVPHAAVTASPLSNPAATNYGVMSDSQGTAWLVLALPGQYRISCENQSLVVNLQNLPSQNPPGYSEIPRITLELP